MGLRTEKSRLQRSLTRLRDLMRRMRHLPVREQVGNLNRVLRGHYAYFGIAGCVFRGNPVNFRALQRVHRFVERYWHKMLCSRSRKGYVRWDIFHRIKARFPLQQPLNSFGNAQDSNFRRCIRRRRFESVNSVFNRESEQHRCRSSNGEGVPGPRYRNN